MILDVSRKEKKGEYFRMELACNINHASIMGVINFIITL